MTNFHSRMMNIGTADYITFENHPPRAYRQGHKDARHAAAEIAVEADIEIAKLKQDIAQLQEVLKVNAETNDRAMELLKTAQGIVVSLAMSLVKEKTKNMVLKLRLNNLFGGD